MEIIVEKVSECNLVKEGAEPNGHDCWGKLEFSSYKYVWIEGIPKTVYDDMFIIRKEDKVLETAYDWNLNCKIEEIKKKETDKNQLKLDL